MTGDPGLLLVLGSVFGATFVAVSTAFAARERSRMERHMAQVMTTGAVHKPAPEQQRNTLRFLPQVLVRIGECLTSDRSKTSGYSGIGARLNTLLERADFTLTAAEFAALSLLGATAAWVLAFLIGATLLFASLVATLILAAPAVVASIAGAKRVAKVQSQLPSVLQVIASSLRAGHSFLQALEAAAKEAPEPSASEFRRVLSEIKLGLDIQAALDAMADRVRSADLRWTVLAIGIQREVGGNMAEVLDTVAHTIRERETVRRQIQVLSAEGRLSMAVLCGLPVAVAGYMTMVNPEYLGLLFSTNLGMVMLVVAACLMTVGIFWMRKVVRIDV